MSNTKLIQFLKYLSGQKETGLLIADNEQSLEKALKVLSQNDFHSVKDWREILANLAKGQSSSVVLGKELSKELYDLIVQYSGRAGMIQIMDKETMELKTVQFDPFQAQLLVVVNKDDLAKIEEKWQIKDKVGLAENI